MFETIQHYLSSDGIREIIGWGGIATMAGIIFAETGLLVGFFLPGDSLLITAGILANPRSEFHVDGLNLPMMMLVLTIAAIVGDQVGFFLGHRVGDSIWERPDGRFYKRRYLEEAHDFYVRYGGLAVVGARFMPILRTFVPFAAGVAKMPYKNFVFWNIGGGVLWINSLLIGGYFLALSPLANRLDKIILVVVFVSLLPMIIGVAKRVFFGKSAAGASV